MPELTNRDTHEREIAAALAAFFADEQRRITGEHFSWIGFQARVQSVLSPRLARIYADSANQLAGELGTQLNQHALRDEAQRWSEQYTRDLARQLRGTTEERFRDAKAKDVAAAHAAEAERRLSQAAGEHAKHDADEKAATLAAALLLLDDDERRPAYSGSVTGSNGLLGGDSFIGSAVAWAFGEERATTISITETTSVAVRGEFSAAASYEDETGLKLKPYWQCERGACEICLPLDGAGPEEWQAVFPQGPPGPHQNCRCWLLWRVAD